MPYRLSDVQAAKAKIAAACPDVILESWQDYGFKLVGYKKEWWTRPPEKPQVVSISQPVTKMASPRSLLTLMH